MCECVLDGNVISGRECPLSGLSPVSSGHPLCTLSELHQQDGHKDQFSMTGLAPVLCLGQGLGQ